jgi:hypothetical protein
MHGRTNTAQARLHKIVERNEKPGRIRGSGGLVKKRDLRYKHVHVLAASLAHWLRGSPLLHQHFFEVIILTCRDGG